LVSTFHELQQKLSMAKQRKAILEYVVEHLSAEFQPAAGQPPKKTLLTDERVQVSQEALEAEIQYMLEDIQGLSQEVAGIMASTLAPPTVQPVQDPPAPVEKKTKKSKTPEQGTTQGEVQS
jgi:hypothetical protein